MKCDVCFHHCELEENRTGFCHVRTLKDGKNIPSNYGLLTALALDPIEKKPLREFFRDLLFFPSDRMAAISDAPFARITTSPNAIFPKNAAITPPKTSFKKRSNSARKGISELLLRITNPLWAMNTFEIVPSWLTKKV